MGNLLELVADEPDRVNEIIQEINKELRWKDDLAPHERMYKRMIGVYAFLDTTGHSFQDTVAVIGLISDEKLAVKRLLAEESIPDNVFASVAMPKEAFGLGIEFIRRVLKEIRKSICGTKTSRGHAGSQHLTKDVITSAVASGLASVGINNSMVLGMSVLVLLVLARASHKSFCDMTDDEVVNAVKATAMTRTNLKKRKGS